MVGAGMTPFAEHFALGIKDLIPMAYAECVGNVDKGIKKSEIQAAWFGELSTTDGFPSGILADTLDLTGIPVTRVENACATGNDAISQRHPGDRLGAVRRGAGGGCGQGARDRVEYHVLGLGGDDPR
jgi:hypothetical protein